MTTPNVLWLTGDWIRATRQLGAVSRQRIGQPDTQLKEQGWDTLVTPHFSIHNDGHIAGRDWQGKRHDRYSIVVLHRSMRDVHVDLVQRARAAGQVVVGEVDDWYWGIPTYNVAFWGTHPKNDADVNRDHYLEILRHCDTTIVSTPYLGSRLSELGVHNWVTCRNGIEVQRFRETYNYNAHHQRTSGWNPMVGWVGGVPWRGADLQTLKGTLGPWLDRHSCTFVHAGYNPKDHPGEGGQFPYIWDMMGLEQAKTDGRIYIKGGASPDDYPQILKDIDIGLVPLADNPFNHAKSCLKGMEYAAAGIPFIAYPTDEYRWLHDTYGIGRLARRPKDWLKHLDELRDPEVRSRESGDLRDRVRQLGMRPMSRQWSDLFKQLT